MVLFLFYYSDDWSDGSRVNLWLETRARSENMIVAVIPCSGLPSSGHPVSGQIMRTFEGESI